MFRTGRETEIVLLMTSIFLVIQICDAQTDRYISVLALGRFSEIGYLYDERSDRIIESTVFRHKISSDFMTEFRSPTTTKETITENSFRELGQMFDISLDTAVNIWTGILKPRGASIILNPNIEQESVLTGTLLVTHETVAQQLHVFYDGLRESYNKFVLNQLNATHVVTGITWGARVAVTLKLSRSNMTNIDAEQIKDQIGDEFLKLEEPDLITEDKNSNFTISVNADVTPTSQGVMKSMKDVQRFLIGFPEQIKTLNGKKGVPLVFSLTPISLIRDFLKEPSRHGNLAYKVRDSILRKLTDIFSNFLKVEQRITNIQTLLSSKPNCVSSQTTQKIEDLNSFFLNSKSALKDALKISLLQVRSGNQSSATLETIAQTYNHKHHSVRSYQSKFAQFDGALQKIGFCKMMEQEDAGSKIEYFGLNQNLIPRISQESQKSVFILFTKTDWAQANAVKFTENLNLILRGFNTSSSSTSRLIVDCDFEQQPFCRNLTDTTIHTYENGILTSTDFKQTVQQKENNVQKQIRELQSATARLGTELNNTLEIAKGNQLYAGQLGIAVAVVKKTFQQNSAKSEARYAAQEQHKETILRNSNKITQVLQMFEETKLMKYKCSARSTCLNGGSCVDTNDGFSCTCLPGFEGTKCEKQTDNCRDNPCKNSGACQNGVSSFTCTCPQGFTGKVCDVSLNECLGSNNPCENGGHCIDEVGGYTCVCPLLYAGRNCQYRMQNPCVSSPCKNGAICAPFLNYADFTCSCDRGFTGTLCEVDIDECSKNAVFCQNGGACTNTYGSFTCNCAAGFTGINCATKINYNSSSSCLNEATCADGINSCSCTCPTSFTGDRCENVAVSICTASEKVSRSQSKVITQSGAGLVNIPEMQSQSSFLFEYKPDASHVDNQKPRVWTISSLTRGKYYALKCKITLLCGNSRDIFSVLEWNYASSGMTLSSTKLTKHSSSFVSSSYWSYKLFLSYTSTNGLSPGFLVSIDILETMHTSIGSNFVYTNGASLVSLSYGPTKHYDKFTVVVNPKETNTTLSVKRLFSVSTTCAEHNTLDIYEIQPKGAPRRLDRLCGSVTLPILHTSHFPFIATFYDDKPSGNTFQLSWD